MPRGVARAWRRAWLAALRAFADVAATPGRLLAALVLLGLAHSLRPNRVVRATGTTWRMSPPSLLRRAGFAQAAAAAWQDAVTTRPAAALLVRGARLALALAFLPVAIAWYVLTHVDVARAVAVLTLAPPAARGLVARLRKRLGLGASRGSTRGVAATTAIAWALTVAALFLVGRAFPAVLTWLAADVPLAAYAAGSALALGAAVAFTASGDEGAGRFEAVATPLVFGVVVCIAAATRVVWPEDAAYARLSSAAWVR